MEAHDRMFASRTSRALRGPGAARVFLLALLGLVVLAGCGPIRSTQRISEAEVALEKARIADAKTKAPYEFYSAKSYLHKSKEEWGYSQFEASFDYATDAKRAAEEALLKAKEDPWEGYPVTAKDKKKAAKKQDANSQAQPASDSDVVDTTSP